MTASMKITASGILCHVVSQKLLIIYAVHTFETSVKFYETTQCNIPEGLHILNKILIIYFCLISPIVHFIPVCFTKYCTLILNCGNNKRSNSYPMFPNQSTSGILSSKITTMPLQIKLYTTWWIRGGQRLHTNSKCVHAWMTMLSKFIAAFAVFN